MNHKKYAVLDYDTFILFLTMVELTDRCISLVQRYRIFTVENLFCRISPGTPMISMAVVLHLSITYECELYRIKSVLLG